MPKNFFLNKAPAHMHSDIRERAMQIQQRYKYVKNNQRNDFQKAYSSSQIANTVPVTSPRFVWLHVSTYDRRSKAIQVLHASLQRQHVRDAVSYIMGYKVPTTPAIAIAHDIQAHHVHIRSKKSTLSAWYGVVFPSAFETYAFLEAAQPKLLSASDYSVNEEDIHSGVEILGIYYDGQVFQEPVMRFNDFRKQMYRTLGINQTTQITFTIAENAIKNLINLFGWFYAPGYVIDETGRKFPLLALGDLLLTTYYEAHMIGGFYTNRSRPSKAVLDKFNEWRSLWGTLTTSGGITPAYLNRSRSSLPSYGAVGRVRWEAQIIALQLRQIARNNPDTAVEIYLWLRYLLYLASFLPLGEQQYGGFWYQNSAPILNGYFDMAIQFDNEQDALNTVLIPRARDSAE